MILRLPSVARTQQSSDRNWGFPGLVDLLSDSSLHTQSSYHLVNLTLGKPETRVSHLLQLINGASATTHPCFEPGSSKRKVRVLPLCITTQLSLFELCLQRLPTLLFEAVLERWSPQTDHPDLENTNLIHYSQVLMSFVYKNLNLAKIIQGTWHFGLSLLGWQTNMGKQERYFHPKSQEAQPKCPII